MGETDNKSVYENIQGENGGRPRAEYGKLLEKEKFSFEVDMPDILTAPQIEEIPLIVDESGKKKVVEENIIEKESMTSPKLKDHVLEGGWK